MSDSTADNEQETKNEGLAGANLESIEAVNEGAAQKAQGSNAAPDFQALAEEWKSKAAYLMAEMDNMRKRFMRERSDLIKLANEGLLRTMLPVLDNLELAIRAAKDAEGKLQEPEKSNPVLKSLFQGVEMTFKHMENTLEQVGVKAIQAVGQSFDPTVHEAVGHSQSSEHPEDQVATEIQRGFHLHERVLRPARVIVNKRPE